MSVLKKVYHLVHPGLDEYENKEYTENVFELIQKIKKEENSILVYVDIPYSDAVFSMKEKELSNIIEIADIIEEYFKYIATDLLTINDGMITIGEKKVNFSHVGIDSHPQEIIDDLQNMTKNLSCLLEQFKHIVDTSKIQIEEKEKEIKGDLRIGKKIIIHYKKAHFREILSTLIEKYSDTDIFGIHTNIAGGHDRGTIQNNKRRQIIINNIHKNLGKNKAIQNYMMDGYTNRYRKNIFKNNKTIFQHGVGNSEPFTYGDAFQDIINMKVDYDIESFTTKHSHFFHQIKQRGMTTNNSTKHIVGGEYIGLCVNNYCRNVLQLLYSIPKENIFIQEDICIRRAGDKGTSQEDFIFPTT